MTGAIRAERRVVFASGIIRIVTSLAGRIERTAMIVQPGRCTMRVRLVDLGNRDRRHRTIGEGDFGQRMAHVALESNRLLVVGGKMLAIVTTETAGRIFVSDIVGVRRPRQVLTGKDQRLINGLEIIDPRFYFGGIVLVVIGIIFGIEPVQRIDHLVRIVKTLVRSVQDFETFFLDRRNGRVDAIEHQTLIERILRRQERVRNTIVAIDAIHLMLGVFVDLIGRQRVFNILVDGLFSVGIRDLNPWDTLLEFIRRNEFDLVLDVPVNAETLSLALRAAADFHQQEGRDEGIFFVGLIMLDDFGAIAGKFFGPMTTLAGIARGQHAIRIDGKFKLSGG